MKPKRSSECECCGTKSPKVLIDSILGQHTPFGIRGSWHWLCVSCHRMLGSGFFPETATLYILVNGKYIEQQGVHYMTVEEIQQTVDMFSSMVKEPVVRAKIVFDGEKALQLAILNRNLEELIALERRRMVEIVAKPVFTDEDSVTGG